MTRRSCLSFVLACVTAASCAGAAWARSPEQPHNVVIFVADGLRYAAVNPEVAPAMAAVQREGVDFRNSHSLYPTITTPNASVIATGHRLGDTGDFGNSVYLGEPGVAAYQGALIAPYEDTDAVFGDANGRFGGNYLHEDSLLATARAQGYSTAAIGKRGPTAIQDVSARDGETTIVVDDGTGRTTGLPLSASVQAALEAAGLPIVAPERGANGDAGTAATPGTLTPNTVQQDWFTAIATRVVLPRFKAADKPFVMVFWSRDPDGTQHYQGDSLNALVPGINGPTSRAATHNVSDDLQRLRDALKALGLDKTTDILVTADHGFSTISKQSATSPSAKASYADVPAGFLPPGFLAIDLAQVLGLPIHEPNGADFPTAAAHSKKGHAVLGADPARPEVVVGANGGSDLIWLPRENQAALARRIVAFLLTQDYTAALFVDDALGPMPGALPLSAVGLKGSALTPAPAIVVAFRSYSTGCATPELCSADVSDTEYQQGQGTHGAFGRADTRNFMAAVGPDFKTSFADPAPVSNADLAWTAARILRLDLNPKGAEVGRVLTEALKGGRTPVAVSDTLRSTPTAGGFVTVLKRQRIGRTPYFDAAGMPGRVLGLEP